MSEFVAGKYLEQAERKGKIQDALISLVIDPYRKGLITEGDLRDLGYSDEVLIRLVEMK